MIPLLRYWHDLAQGSLMFLNISTSFLQPVRKVKSDPCHPCPYHRHCIQTEDQKIKKKTLQRTVLFKNRHKANTFLAFKRVTGLNICIFMYSFIHFVTEQLKTKMT